MRIKSVEIRNFMRLRHAKLNDLHNKEVIGILAQGVHDKGRSNFLGKSSTIEAIRYCLTGQYKCKKESQLVHHGEDFMFVIVVVINDEGEEFKIKRGVTAKGDSSLETDWADKKTAAQESINKLLGFTKEDFDLTYYFGQDMINIFMQKGSAEQKKLLMKWQENDHWTLREKAVLSDIKELKDDIKVDQVTLDNLKRAIGGEDDLREKYESVVKRIKNSKNSVNNLKNKLSEFDENYPLEQAKKAKSELMDVVDDLESAVEKYKRIKGHSDKIETLQKQIEKIDVSGKKEEVNLESNIISELRVEAGDLQKKVDLAKGHDPKGICPLIKEPCDRIKPNQKTIDSCKLRLEEIKDEIGSRKTTITWHEELIDVYRKNTNLIEKLQAEIDFASDLKIRIQKLTQKKQELTKLAELFNPDKVQERKELVGDLVFAEDDLEEANKELSVIKYRLEKFKESNAEIERLTDEIINKTIKLDDLNYLAYMFGKNGIPSLEIENSFHKIEENINYMLSEIIDGIEIEFKPDREIGKWEPNCLSCGWKFPKNYKKSDCENCNEQRRKQRKDEITLDVVEQDEVISFDACSGGLKTLVSLSIRVALALLIINQRHSDFRVLFLDEIDSALDATNKQSIKELITKVLIKKLGFQQVFWISHDKSISHNVPHTLLVKGHKTYSTLEWL